MKIILEGPNNVGKSTIAAKISEYLNWPVKHYGADFGNTYKDWDKELSNDADEIWDRSFICERVYPYVDNRKARLAQIELIRLLREYKNKVIIIYIDADDKFIINGYKNKKEKFSQDYLDRERDCYLSIMATIENVFDTTVNWINDPQEVTDAFIKRFAKYYNLKPKQNIRFSKGYEADAGVDIYLDKDVTFKAGEITIVDLNVKFTFSSECRMAYLVARTSAAAKGLLVQSCPIDANYTGNLQAIVYNFSKEDVVYPRNSAFCQLVYLPIVNITNCEIRKNGKRSSGNFGSTNK